MPSLDMIRAITTNAAEILGWQNLVGAIEPGKFADLVVVAGDPIDDITELERVRLVMKGGPMTRTRILLFRAACIAVGAILDFAVKVQNSHGFNLNRVGLILMIVGIVGLIISLFYWQSWGGYGFGGGYRRTRVVRNAPSRTYTNSAGQVVQEPGTSYVENSPAEQPTLGPLGLI